MAASAVSARFGKKRDAIMSAARSLMYRRGLRAMTFADIAEEVGLSSTSITYYFPRKEDLAAACLLSGAERLNAMLSEAEEAADGPTRILKLFEAFFAHHRATRFGDEDPIPSFGEMRALDETRRRPVQEAFVSLTRRLRDLFDGPDFAGHSRRSKTALAHVLFEQIFWAMSWLHQYDVADYPRILERMCDIYFNGLAGRRSDWSGRVLDPPHGEDSDRTGDDFLIAATRLFNRSGYRGASVERISAELNVTKGSFYHHNVTKEDLAAACFQRSIDIARRVQRRALETGETSWDQLETAVCTLVDFQLSERGPLAREWLMAVLPETLRSGIADRLERVTRRFAGMVADGAADGSLRIVDPLVAAQLLKVTINAAAEAPSWVKGLKRGEASGFYARPILMGALAPPI